MIQAMKKILISIVVILAVLIGFSVYTSKYWLTVSYYEISSEKIEHGFRIVQLTDLHDSVFGENNSKLIDTVTEQEPDLILITGDLLDYNIEDLSIAVNVIEQLSTCAPVYVSFGNHEDMYEKLYGTDVRAVYTDAGAHVLDFEYEEIEVNGQMIRLGGIYGYCLPMKYSVSEPRLSEALFIEEYQDTDLYTLLMCHMPVCWIINGSMEAYDVDCVVSGHAHGGQIQIPFVGGLYAPDQGWFPEEVYGVYPSYDGKKHLIVSRGLGNSIHFPRINNRPELVVVDILPEA